MRLSSEPQTGSVVSADGTRVAYDLYPAGSRNLVLVIPGFWRTRRWHSLLRLGQLLNDQGYSAAIMDVRGHGDTGGVFGFNLHESEDVYAVARHLAGSEGYEAITLMGFSVGGAVAICTAAAHPELPLQSLLLFSPVARFGMIRPWLNPFRMNQHLSAANAMRPPRFTWRFLTSKKLCAADEIRNVNVPVCFVHTKGDWLIHHRHSLLLHERANEPKELHLLELEDRYHADRILRVESAHAEELIADFLARTLPQKQKAALSRGL